tara:strand:+ start:311 stop:601 length:291 start_codon:yes stop_codon:yes gene_type:complete
MAKFYCNIASGDTVTSIQNNGSQYDVSISQDLDCSKVTASGEVKCTSTTAPFYPPVVNSSQRTGMTVTAGAMVYDSTENFLYFYNGSAWKKVEVVA